MGLLLHVGNIQAYYPAYNEINIISIV